MTKILTVLCFCLLLVGCASNPVKQDVEMPYSDHPEGIDEERVSPCACVEYQSLINLG